MSEVTDLIRRYHAGEVSFAELKRTLATFPDEAPEEPPAAPAERYWYVRDLGGSTSENGWERVELARDNGLLTLDELLDISEAVDDAEAGRRTEP